MAEIMAMTCPNCGASVPKGAFACEFCGSHLARVATGAGRRRGMIACPVCGAGNDVGRSFCAACGAQVAENCPNCGRAGPLGAAYCGHCGLSRAEARQRALDERVQQARREGWHHPLPPEYGELCRAALSPEETVIIFHRGVGEPYVCPADSGEKVVTALVVTDHSFLFVEPPPVEWLARRGDPTVIKVPFEEVSSLTVEVASAELVIGFEGGQGHVALPVNRTGEMAKKPDFWDAWSATCQKAARDFVYYVKPFLPARLSREW